MNVLVCTAIQRAPNGSAFLFPAAMQSIHALQWHTQLDYFQMSGGDAQRGDPVTRKYAQVQALALLQGYDAVLFAESDMIIPSDALEKLVALDCEIAYGLYAMRLPPHQWSAYTELTLSRGVSLSQQPDKARAAWGEVIEVAGVGHGCTLVRRNVLETVTFRPHASAGCDWMMSIDAQYYGFRQLCDTSVICGHIDRDGKTVYWPDPDAPNLYRVETL